MISARNKLFPSLGAILFGVPGLFLAIGGGYLLSLGGSAYYLLAGVAMLATALLLLIGNRLAPAVYFAFVIATMAWAGAEVGFSPWGLLPRIALPTGLSLWFVIPEVRRRLDRGPALAGVANAPWGVAIPIVLVLAASGAIFSAAYAARFLPVPAAQSQPGTPIARATDSWNFYGNSIGGDRFSSADQITRGNVGNLKLAWTYRTGDEAPMFEGAPLKIGERLYLCTAKAAISIDAVTGKQVWRYDPGIDNSAAPNKACRGVSYYPGTGAGAFCDARLLWPTLDDHMHAIDVATGRPCPDFGKGGVVDTGENLGQVIPGYHYTTSPPLIIGDAAIFGALVYDNQSKDEPSGVVRAIDVHSGKLLWGWEGIAPTSRKSLAAGEIFARSSPNAWGVFSADPALGLVYIPTGNATPDYFGGYRTPEQDRYSSSIVALDAKTGDVRWSFQTMHHDIWDMDIPAQPVVTDIDTRNGRRGALVVPTKRGEIFVLDRRTGKPIYPVVERAVPQGAAPGEHLSPTQPYTTGFPTFTPPKLREADMWGATMLDQMLCRITFKQHRYEGQFTPISLQGTVGYPDVFGVFSWGSVAVDPERQIMFVNASWLPYLARLFPRAVADAGGVVPYNTAPKTARPKGTPALHGDWLYAQAGTPYASESKPFLSQLGFPCHQPPWGAVAAVDLRRGKVMWQRPFGTTRDAAPLGISLPTGVFNIGGSLLTRGGVAFIGAAIDNYIRGYDIETGKLLWQARLPAGGQANPITYVSKRSGKQFVVIAAGGHAAMQTKTGDYLIAYSLPDRSN
jgi:quinoprotein glucose dehydrogenase/quinate dehydrogenase (quinone)